MREHVEPAAVAQLVETYIQDELRDAGKYENRAPLDENGVFALHLLAAEVYARGVSDGDHAARIRSEARLWRQAPQPNLGEEPNA